MGLLLLLLILVVLLGGSFVGGLVWFIKVLILIAIAVVLIRLITGDRPAV